jgi:hypothetical protein
LVVERGLSQIAEVLKYEAKVVDRGEFPELTG